MTNHPNILVVLSDQQRPDSAGVYGQALPTTPHLDALARDGVVFDNAFTVQPVCGPARASIQTGRYPTSIGCWRNGLALPGDVPTLAGTLADLGYWTGYVGKWHLASDLGPGRSSNRPRVDHSRSAVPPERRGGYRDAWVAADALEHTSRPYTGHLWDETGGRVELDGYRVDAVTDLAIDRLSRRDDDRPFLMFVSYLEPHHQNDRGRSIGPRGWARRFADHDVPGDLSGRFGDWRWNYAQYLACCASIDANLGRLLATLADSGQLDDTLVVYASDHGSHFRTRNLEYKRTCHDASIRIPLVMAGPGFRGGQRCGSLVTHLDLLPTLVRAAGGEPGPGAPAADGRALQDRAASDWRDAVLVQLSESQIGRALRTSTHTISVRAATRRPLAAHRRPSAASYVVDKLYDNDRDPHQRRNLRHDPGSHATQARLTERLLDEIERIEGHRPTITSR